MKIKLIHLLILLFLFSFENVFAQTTGKVDIDMDVLEQIYEDYEEEEEDFIEQLVIDYTSSLDMDCIDVKVEGMCVWMTITPTGGVVISYSPIITMYSPDAKVEAYHTKYNTPYLLAKLNHEVAAGMGGTLAEKMTGFLVDNNSSMTEGFRSAHVMGNPMLPAHQATIKPIFDAMMLGYCESTVEPFKTYFHSDLDFMEWRFGLMEQFYYPLNALKIVKNTTSMWGSLYPRTGWTMNSSPYIGASIASLRAANIANNNPEDAQGLHIFETMPSKLKGNMYQVGEAARVTHNEGKWQPMNIGDEYRDSCDVFPTPNIDLPLAGTDEPFKQGRDYFYTLWRKHSCCRRAGAILIGTL